MKKIAFIFPGQGSQYVGMGKSFYDRSDAARRAYEEANDSLGYDIRKLSFEGPQAELDLTENTQPALLAASVAAMRVLRENSDAVPGCLAGHSLGEYTALVVAGALCFGDAVRLVHLRGKFMQESVLEGAGKMCAVLGLSVKDVLEVCKSASLEGGIVVPANINSPEQIVVSGHTGAVERAASIAKERGAKKVIPLQVSAPSHSPLMVRAAERLKMELDKITFKSFGVPVLTNVEASPADPARIKELLALQLISPVRWVDIIRRMKTDGISDIFEIGPGKVLSGLVRRIEKNINLMSLNEMGDMEKVLGALNAP